MSPREGLGRFDLIDCSTLVGVGRAGCQRWEQRRLWIAYCIFFVAVNWTLSKWRLVKWRKPVNLATFILPEVLRHALHMENQTWKHGWDAGGLVMCVSHPAAGNSPLYQVSRSSPKEIKLRIRTQWFRLVESMETSFSVVKCKTGVQSYADHLVTVITWPLLNTVTVMAYGSFKLSYLVLAMYRGPFNSESCGSHVNPFDNVLS